MQWYYAVNGQQQGPVEWDVLIGLAREGTLKPADLVWNKDMGNQWAKAGTVSGLFAPAPVTTPPSASEWTAGAQFKGATHNRDLMAAARLALSGNWGTGVSGVLVYTLACLGLSLLGMVVPFLGQLVGFVLTGALMLGWYRFFQLLARNEGAEVSVIFGGFKQFGTAFLAYLLMALLVLAWMGPGLVLIVVAVLMTAKQVISGGGLHALFQLVWLIPLVLVAMIPAMIAQYRYSLTYFVINDTPGIGSLEAIRHSTRLMNGNKWKLLCLQFRFLGWALLCIPTLGVGMLWLLPYMMTSLSGFYDDVRKGQLAP